MLCNNKANGGDDFHSIGTTIPTTPRAVRATKVLREKIGRGEKVSVEFFKEMQMDTVDEVAKKLAPLLVSLTEKYKDEVLGKGRTGTVDRMLGILAGWDGSFDEDSKEALVYSKWLDFIHSTLLHVYFTDVQERIDIIGSFFFENFVGKLADEWSKGQNLNSSYCINEYNKNKKIACMENVVHALEEAYKHIVSKFGKNEVSV